MQESLCSMDRIRDAIEGTGPPLVIAEVAQAHDGSLGAAHAYIDAAAAAGADAIKFQTHIAEAESSDLEPWRVPFSTQDATRYDYWKRTGFEKEQWRKLKIHADEKGLIFLSSPFSLQAIEWLQEIGVPAWKVASGEVNNPLLMDAMIATGKPLLVSSGMSSWEELNQAVMRIRQAGVPFLLMQCTTAYPCPPEQWGLNVLEEMKEHYDCAVGFSDHSGTIYPALAAVTLGARAIEVHLTLSKLAFGPDVPASLTTDELLLLTTGVRNISTAMNHPVDKDAVAAEKRELRLVFGQSLVASRDLAKGHVLVKEDLTCRKPAFAGIPVADWEQVTGRTLVRPVVSGSFLSREDFELL